MNSDLQALIELQEIDLKTQELDKQIQNVPSQIQSLQQILDTGASRLNTLKESLAEKQKGRRKSEQDVESFKAKLSRLKDQLMSVKTNKEYTAMLKEIEVCDTEIRGAEDQILVFMESTDSLEADIRRVEREVKEEAEKISHQRQELEARIEQHRQAIEGMAGKRAEVEKRINTDLLKTYRRLLNHRKGLALAEARDECCMACRVRMRPQVFNDVKKNERILNCDSCGRILYFVPPPAAAQNGSNSNSKNPENASATPRA